MPLLYLAQENCQLFSASTSLRLSPIICILFRGDRSASTHAVESATPAGRTVARPTPSHGPGRGAPGPGPRSLSDVGHDVTCRHWVYNALHLCSVFGVCVTRNCVCVLSGNGTDVSRRPAALDRGPRSGRAPEAEAPGGDGHSEITPWKSTKAAKTLEPIKAE